MILLYRTNDPQYEEYTDSVTSIGGRRYIDPAGTRKRIEINYDGNIDASVWADLINDILTHIIDNGNQFFDFYFDATKTTANDLVEVQPEDIGYLVEYTNQIGQFVPSLTLIERDRTTSATYITGNFEAP